MKKVVLLLMVFIIAIAGCAKKEITEKEFSLVWKEYLRREFEENFDEKQSVSQKEKILNQLANEYQLTLEDLKSYMEITHKDKYKKIFID